MVGCGRTGFEALVAVFKVSLVDFTCPGFGHSVAFSDLTVGQALESDGSDDEACFRHAPSSGC